MLTADDIARVFADGKLVAHPWNNGVWNRAQQYAFSNDTEIIAVEIKNTGGPGGLVASFSNGRVNYISQILLMNSYCFDIICWETTLHCWKEHAKLTEQKFAFSEGVAICKYCIPGSGCQIAITANPGLTVKIF